MKSEVRGMKPSRSFVKFLFSYEQLQASGHQPHAQNEVGEVTKFKGSFKAEFVKNSLS